MWLVGFYYPKRMNKSTEYCPQWIFNIDITDLKSIDLASFTITRKLTTKYVLKYALQKLIDTYKTISSVTLIFRVHLLKLNYYCKYSVGKF